MKWKIHSKQCLTLLPVIFLLLVLFLVGVEPAQAALTQVGFTSVETFSSLPALEPVPATTTATQTPVRSSTPTATSTPLSTPTPIRTSTSTQIGAYPGPVQSVTPGLIQSPSPTQGGTPYPGPSASASPQSVQTATEPTSNLLFQAGNPTTTLRPFPSITLELPDITQTPTPSGVPVSGTDDSTLSGWMSMVRLGPLALILLIWVLLGGWFYLTLRRMD